MPLVELWKNNRIEFESKHISQLVGLASDGKLSDSGMASAELRDFLDEIPSSLLERFVNECLTAPFLNSGLVLQDLINQLGKRLGFSVRYGRYKGVKGQPGAGFDGIWIFPMDEHAIVVEAKTTDAYRIDLDRIAGYQNELLINGDLSTQGSSILLVVGREDTGDLESQIRGSRHSWDVRLLSIEGLLKLVHLKEDTEDPNTIKRIHGVLIPQEFTRLDGIIDLAFEAVADLVQAELPDIEVEQSHDETPPASFHDACVLRAEQRLGLTLVRRSRATYSSTDEQVAVTCHVSKFYDRQGYQYWFAFHPHQRLFLSKAKQGYVMFGCGSPDQLLLIPFLDMTQWLDSEKLNTTGRGESYYYHIQIAISDNKFWLVRKRGLERIDLSVYQI